MTTNSVHKTPFGIIKCTRSTSPTINNKYKTNSIFTSCCGCSCTRPNSPPINKYKESENGRPRKLDTKSDVHKGLFKRIQCFKGLKIIFLEC